MFWELKATIMEWIVKKIVTDYPFTVRESIYAILWNCDKGEINTYLKQIEKAKAETNCLTFRDYLKWRKNNNKF